MSLLIRKVRNETANTFTLFVPGFSTPPVTLAPSVIVDLLALVSPDELETMQGNINGLISRGSISSQGTIDTTVLQSSAYAKVQAQIVLPNAPAAAVSYTQADVQAMVDLLNDLKAKVNGMNS